jgi:lipopolysaccharide/colanic/teichoic acid biosynthesis glycosyltransferase
MKLSVLLKYGLRFVLLQIILTYFSIFYLNNFLISDARCENCAGFSFRMQINNNLWEDRNRFFSFVDERLVTVETFFILFIFVFLIILYSTKFYTYVNELSYSLDRSYLDEYFSIYLLWTSSFVVFLTIFRISNLISRGYLVLFTFLVPLILLMFRNSEFISSLLGRSVTNENYITFNLEEDSIFRNLRIMTFRKNIGDFNEVDLNKDADIIKIIDSTNKNKNVNLIVINLYEKNKISQKLEEYLIKLNKKVLLISKAQIEFHNFFLYRSEHLSKNNLIYFNNDIQYGSKYILKRVLDLLLGSFALIIFSPIMFLIYVYIVFLDGGPAIIKQKRVGLHGKQFNMYKFRTMKNESHDLRDDLQNLNKNDAVIFKIEDDPRILRRAKFLRNLSLDELPQLFNVIKGQMSLVGPRPLFDEDTNLFDENYMRRLNVLPGITGLLQINERNTSEFSTWYKYDIEYIENWSLYLDIAIILKTPFALFSRKEKGL